MMTVFETHLDDLDLLPELRHAIELMLRHEATVFEFAENQPWINVIPTIQRALDATAIDMAPFTLAWRLMYAATRRLDQLQDGDPISDAVFAALPPGVQYNQVFAYYLLATSLLNQQVIPAIPVSRLLRLHAFWSTTMLRIASGQQRDLMLQADGHAVASVETYQQLVQAKTGAAFALAFGGVAMLSTDNTRTISALQSAGEAYGALLQYADDISDIAEQSGALMTLPAVLSAIRPDVPTDRTATFDAFFLHVYRAYHAHISAMLMVLPHAARTTILDLFENTFGSVS